MPDSYLVHSNWLAYTFPSKSDKILLLGQIFSNLGFGDKLICCPC